MDSLSMFWEEQESKDEQGGLSVIQGEITGELIVEGQWGHFLTERLAPMWPRPQRTCKVFLYIHIYATWCCESVLCGRSTTWITSQEKRLGGFSATPDDSSYSVFVKASLITSAPVQGRTIVPLSQLAVLYKSCWGGVTVPPLSHQQSCAKIKLYKRSEAEGQGDVGLI